MPSWSAETVRAAMAAKPAALALLPEPAAAVVNELVDAECGYVVAVNDRALLGRCSGSGQGHETGVAQTITVGVPTRRAYYELTTSQEVAPEIAV